MAIKDSAGYSQACTAVQAITEVEKDLRLGKIPVVEIPQLGIQIDPNQAIQAREAFIASQLALEASRLAKVPSYGGRPTLQGGHGFIRTDEWDERPKVVGRIPTISDLRKWSKELDQAIRDEARDERRFSRATPDWKQRKERNRKRRIKRNGQ